MMLAREILDREFGARGAVVLPDGLAVRAVSSGDVERLRRMFSRSSPATIYRRFHSPFPRVPEWAIERLASAESLVAAVGDEVVGHAMYVCTEDGREAEAAVVVEDGWQSMGIGKLLLGGLAAEGRQRGIEAFTCVTLAENRRAFLLVAAVFAEVGYALEDGSYAIRALLRSLKTNDVVHLSWTSQKGGR
jgi:GNAT superfamily N-acetyltransferase